ncbi:MAG: hypothetical protein AB1916_10115 [Thermodesulfobacteriota bacterium]
MRRILLAAAALVLLASPGLARDPECTDGGAVTGPGFGYMLTAPSGWCFFFKDDSDADVRALLTPELSEPAAAPVSIRVRVVFRSDTTLNDLWQAEINRFKARRGEQYAASWGLDIPFAKNFAARTLDLFADGYGPRTTVAIAEQARVFVVLTYAADAADLHDWHRETFRRFAKEYVIPMQ